MNLDGTYDLRLAALSVLIAVCVSYTALSLMARATGDARRWWIGAAALTLGIGVWAMHFVGMLALRMPDPVSFDIALTLGAMLPAVAGTAWGLALAGGNGSPVARSAGGGLVMGGGIAAMHFTGMAAMQLPGTLRHDPTLSALAIVVAIAAATAGCWLVTQLRGTPIREQGHRTLAGALLLGIAISGMHYTGVAAITLDPAGVDAQIVTGGFDSFTLASMVALITLLVLATSLALSTADRRLAAQRSEDARALETIRADLEKKVEERTRRLREAVDLLKRDIRAREQVEAALQSEKERVEITLNAIADAVITTDPNGLVDYINPAAERLLGWAQSEASGKKLSEVCRLFEDPRSDIPVRPLDPGFQPHDPGTPNRYVLLRPDGRRLVVEEATTLLRDPQGNPSGTVMVLHDVTQSQHMADELRYHASHDPLTGLINRREFERRLQVAIKEARSDRTNHALVYIDLDQFKVVNDVSGHLAGDALLRDLAAILREKVRDEDTLARLGGDEFGVLLLGCPLKQAEAVAENLRKVIEAFTFNWHGKTFSIGASIGLVPITFDSDTVTGLLSAADVACYAAKDLGRNRVQVYHPSNEELAQRHGEMHWVAGVNKALQQDRFVLFAQTIKPLREGGGTLPHREILIRIAEKDGTLIPPGAFIPPAERYDLMPKVDRWVIQNLFASIGDYLHEHPAHDNGHSAADQLGMIAVNLSAASVNDELFIHFLRDRFNETGVPPEVICFEITETAVMASLDRARNFIRQVRAMGCRLALDDFGSGMSSFNYLKNLPIDYLKIDGGFIRDLARDAVDQTIVESINRTGHALGIRTVAEMVEDDATLEILRRIGVDYAQGMAVSPPRPLFQPEALEARCGEVPPEDLETTLVGLPRPH